MQRHRDDGHGHMSTKADNEGCINMPRHAKDGRHHQKLEGDKEGFSPREDDLIDFDFRFAASRLPASRTVKEHISVVWSHCLWYPITATLTNYTTIHLKKHHHRTVMIRTIFNLELMLLHLATSIKRILKDRMWSLKSLTREQHPPHPRLPPSQLPLPVTLNKMFTHLPSSLQTVGKKRELSM